MPHYLIEVGYTPEAWAAMVKNPQDRLSLVRPPIEKLGGRLETGYLTFGDYDLVCICEFPDNASAAAFHTDTYGISPMDDSTTCTRRLG